MKQAKTKAVEYTRKRIGKECDCWMIDGKRGCCFKCNSKAIDIALSLQQKEHDKEKRELIKKYNGVVDGGFTSLFKASAEINKLKLQHKKEIKELKSKAKINYQDMIDYKNNVQIQEKQINKLRRQVKKLKEKNTKSVK